MRFVRAALVCVACYTALTLIITYPLVRYFSTRVPHDLGDPLLSTVILWWNAHRLPLSSVWWNGPFFFPAEGTLAFSDHRLGASLIASPLQWAGVGPIAAYNLTLLAMFPLSAAAAHWLGYTLTARHDAAIVAGLAYGFSPYRFGHIEHLELLAAFGMPVALVALHRYLIDRRPRWLIVFCAALVIQALSSSYYFLFFSILLALWMIWFLRRRDLAALAGICAAGAAAVAIVSPIALRYAAIHEHYNLTRTLHAIVTLSADVTSYVTTSALSVLWGWTSTLNGPERQLFPGLTILLLIAAALVFRRSRERDGRSIASRVLFGTAIALTLIAASALWLGPWRAGPISVGTPFKPFSLAVLTSIAAVLVSSPLRSAYRRKSVLAFYVLAAGVLALFSLGPKPGFLHQQFLYEPPYAWLMSLGIFRDSVRVPARFGMLVILALSAASAVAFARLNERRSQIVLACIVAGVLADSWIAPLPMLAPPPSWPPQVSSAGITSFVTLPLGDLMLDIASMYRATGAGLPTVNGNSGFLPTHYMPLQRGLESRDDTALDALTTFGPMLVAVDRAASQSADRVAWLQRYSNSKEIFSDADATWFKLPARARPASACPDATVPVVAMRDWWGPLSANVLTDGDDATIWMTAETQHAGDLLVLDLGRVARPCSVRLFAGAYIQSYPELLSVDTSLDGATWSASPPQHVAGLAILDAIDHPRRPSVEIPVGAASARFIRLRLEADESRYPWVVADLAVTAAAVP